MLDVYILLKFSGTTRKIIIILNTEYVTVNLNNDITYMEIRVYLREFDHAVKTACQTDRRSDNTKS